MRGSIVVFVLILCSSAFAQMSQEELRRERQETIEELRSTQDVSGASNFIWRGLSNATGWEFDYGGWYAPTYTGGDNGTDRQSSTPDSLEHTWEHDLRTFLRVSSGTGKTKFYARLQTTSTINTTNTAAIDRHNWDQPSFDMLYLEHSLTGRTFKHTWTFGRQYAQVERGISFGMVADGLRYELASRRNEIQIFFLRQSPGDDNVDAGVTSWNPGRTKRMFYAAEWKWQYLMKHKLGVFLLSNNDNNFENADAAGQKHQLDSLFYGIGFEGTAPLLSRLSYWLQYVAEEGKTYSSFATTASTSKIDLSASAMDVGLRYFFPTSVAPTVYWEYASGSGDGDATGSATSTAGGSTAGSDGRFISFGGLSLGYALAPQLINLNATKFGVSVKPFGWSGSRLLSELVVQPTYYSYSRDKAAGAISDPVAGTGAGSSKKVGSEFDMTIAWRLAGDLKYQFKWGRFSPGAAYPAASRSTESYLRLKLSLDL